MTSNKTPDTAKGNLHKLENPFGYAAKAEEPEAAPETTPTKSFLEGILARSEAEHNAMKAFCGKEGVAFPKFTVPEL